MGVTEYIKPRSIARKALTFYIQKAGSNQNAAFDFITYLADKLFKIKIDTDDTEAGYLEDKLTASGFSEVEIVDVDGYKSININSEADLGDLNDVVITDIQDGDILSYDAETQDWLNAQIPEIPEHNYLDGLQGIGGDGGYYHLTEDEYDLLLDAGTVDGSVLRWNDTSEKWEESEHINIADDNSIIVIGARDSENDNAHIIYTIDEFAKRDINLICIDPNNTDNLATISAINRGIGGLGTCAVFLRAENNYFYIGESNAGSGIVYQDYSTGDVLFNVSTAGKLLSKYLAGTGNRLLYADESGNIEASTGLEGDLHTHTNKDVLDGIIDSGDGDEFLSDDGSYKAITGLPTGSQYNMLIKGATSWGGSGRVIIDTINHLFSVGTTTTLAAITTGVYNYAFGEKCLEASTNSVRNVAIGFGALRNHNSNNKGWSIAIGADNPLGYSTSGDHNVAIGNSALSALTTGTYNVSLGNYAGQATNGNYNVFMGHRAGYNNTGSSNIFIGFNAGYNETGDNKLYISNTNTTTPLIYGDFSTQVVTINNNLIVEGLTASKLVATDSTKKLVSTDLIALSGGSVVKMLTADVTRESNTTLAAVSDFTQALLASSKYRITAKLTIHQVGGEADFKMQLAAPSGSTITGCYKIWNDGVNTQVTNNLYNDLTAEKSIEMDAYSDAAGYYYIEIEGVIETSSTAGNFTFSFAQLNSTAEITKLKKYSIIELTKI